MQKNAVFSKCDYNHKNFNFLKKDNNENYGRIQGFGTKKDASESN